MLKPSPFHARTQALCSSYQWKDWAGYAAVCTYDAHSEREYFAARHGAGLLDVSPLYKYEIRGSDGARLLSRLFTRDVTRLGVNRVTYGCLVDAAGNVLDDGTVARLTAEHWRLTCSEPWLAWLRRHGRRLDVTIEDSSEALGALAVQGPMARRVLQQITDLDLDRMRFFRVREAELAGAPGWISRTGYTGDLGFEVWMGRDAALPVWDALLAAGSGYGLQPMGLDALDVLRLEAGFVLQGVDYVSARSAAIPSRRSSPHEAGLGWTWDSEREIRCLGHDRIAREARDGAAWSLVGMELDWAGLEALYAKFGINPHLAPCASRDPVPVYEEGGLQVGYVTSHTWSPLLKRYIALATLQSAHAATGTQLQVEHTVEFQRRRVAGTVVERPFFDPPRKRSTPGGRARRAT